MLAIITADDLPSDVPGSEALLVRHETNKKAMDAKKPAFDKFQEEGQKLIGAGHFMAEEVRERLIRLENFRAILDETWERRKTVYEMNLDVRKFLRDADQLNAWLTTQEPALTDPNVGDSLEAVEDLIKKHEDLTKVVSYSYRRSSLRTEKLDTSEIPNQLSVCLPSTIHRFCRKKTSSRFSNARPCSRRTLSR